MIVAVTSTGPTLDDQVEARFGRCLYFLIVDIDSMQVEAVQNPNLALGGGAGIQSAQMMAEKGVHSVLTGNCGPNAFSVFGQAGVEVIVGVTGRVRDAVERFTAGAFSSARAANVQSHFGMASGAPQGQAPNADLRGSHRGGGMGMGQGGGRGMGGGCGRGRGRGMGFGMGWNPWVGPGESGTMPETGGVSYANQTAGRGASYGVRKAAALVRPERCAGCGICVDVCPAGAIRIEQQHAVVDPVVCTACAACVAECPNEAIIIVQQRVGS
jgi:predicted Fe-Mo cluster-binding NifX family protein/NAD-dependent dihydropyrimidine dehydrogenase PreA subunit